MTDLARLTAIEPSRARRALRELMNQGLVTNDRFDPARAGSEETLRSLSDAARARQHGRLDSYAAEAVVVCSPRGALVAATRLSLRFGSPRPRVDRRLARAIWNSHARNRRDSSHSAPSWSEVAPYLSRSEWRGELRRGYFVEGLSGVQYATADAAIDLARLAAQPDT